MKSSNYFHTHYTITFSSLPIKALGSKSTEVDDDDEDLQTLCKLAWCTLHMYRCVYVYCDHNNYYVNYWELRCRLHFTWTVFKSTYLYIYIVCNEVTIAFYKITLLVKVEE